jgi:ribosomal protein L37E
MDDDKRVKLPDEHPNFRINGKLYLVRCHKCGKENYALNVSSGQCAWCGWSETKEEK